jgi:hypothetical protein
VHVFTQVLDVYAGCVRLRRFWTFTQ